MATIQQNLERIVQAKEDIRKSLFNLGLVSIPEDIPIDKYAQYIEGTDKVYAMRMQKYYSQVIELDSPLTHIPFLRTGIRATDDTEIICEFANASPHFNFFGTISGPNTKFAVANNVDFVDVHYVSEQHRARVYAPREGKIYLGLAKFRLEYEGGTYETDLELPDKFEGGEILIGAWGDEWSDNTPGFPWPGSTKVSCDIKRIKITQGFDEWEFLPKIQNGVCGFSKVHTNNAEDFTTSDFVAPEQNLLVPVFERSDSEI